MGFNPCNDACLTIFSLVYPASFDFPPNASVLEIGCAEADWMTPMLGARPDLDLHGIDWRGCKRPGSITQGDVLTQYYPPSSFDAIVFISSLEHIGLGHYDHDPIDSDGDIKALARAHDWLKPGGRVYFDVPWNPDPGYELYKTKCRIYDDHALDDRLGRGQGKWYQDASRAWRQTFRGWTPYADTSRLLQDRPTKKAERWYYCANVWEKA